MSRNGRIGSGRIDPTDATVLLQEVAEMLLDDGANLMCAPSVELEDDAVVLTVVVPRQQGLLAVSLFHALEFLQRAGRVRAFGAVYGVNVQPVIDEAEGGKLK